MNTQNKEAIDRLFIEQSANVQNGLSAIYDQIVKEMVNITPEKIGSEIAKKEALLVNSYIQELVKEVKKDAIQAMVDNGCKSYLTETGWTDIIKKTGVPQVKYCKFQNIPNVGSNAHNTTAEQSKIYASEVSKLQKTQKIEAGVAVAGATIVVASLLVPGWNTAEIIFVSLGAAMLIVGGTSAVITESKIREAREKGKIHNNAARPATVNLNEMLKKVTQQQCQCNIQIINEWLDKVKEALIAECDELSNL